MIELDRIEPGVTLAACASSHSALAVHAPRIVRLIGNALTYVDVRVNMCHMLVPHSKSKGHHHHPGSKCEFDLKRVYCM